MLRIHEIKNLLPLDIDQYTMRLIEFRDLDWYIINMQSAYFNQYLDKKMNKRPYMKLMMPLTDLVVGYRTNTKCIGAGRIIMVDKNTGDRVAGCTLFEKDKDIIELGYWVLPAYQGKGIATKMICEIRDRLLELEDVNVLRLEIRGDNIRSLKLAEKCGFKCVDKIQGAEVTNSIYEIRRL